jgi:hypothetical protein
MPRSTRLYIHGFREGFDAGLTIALELLPQYLRNKGNTRFQQGVARCLNEVERKLKEQRDEWKPR